MKINKIENIKKLNIICTNAEETKGCFSILEKLGLETISNEFSKNNECREHNDRDILINFNMNRGKFINQHSFCLHSCFRKNINFYNFKKETRKFIPTSKEILQVEYDEKAMIDYIRHNKVAINCPTEDDYNIFTDILEKNGEKWCDGDIFSKENIYYDYKDESCISYFLFNDFGYGDISFYKNGLSYKILTVQELFDKFKIEKKEENIYGTNPYCIDPNFSMEVIDKDRVDTVGDIILDNEDFIIIKKR